MGNKKRGRDRKYANGRISELQSFILKPSSSLEVYLFYHNAAFELLKVPHKRKLHMIRIQAEMFKMKLKTPTLLYFLSQNVVRTIWRLYIAFTTQKHLSSSPRST